MPTSLRDIKQTGSHFQQAVLRIGNLLIFIAPALSKKKAIVKALQDRDHMAAIFGTQIFASLLCRYGWLDLVEDISRQHIGSGSIPYYY